MRISIRNLTKIYNNRTKFQSDLDKFSRILQRRLREGAQLYTPDSLRRELPWELFAMGILIYLHMNLRSEIWLFLLAVASYAILLRFMTDLTRLYLLRTHTPLTQAQLYDAAGFPWFF